MGFEEVDGVITTAGGRRVGYLARGPRDGRAVVYLHGMPGCRLEQRLFPSDVLERFNVRVVSVDRPGWGETDALAGDRIARVGDVLPVCDALGINSFPLISVSAGGSYAVTLAAIAPERVERLVLVQAQMPYDDESAIQALLPEQLALLPGLKLGRIPPVVSAIEAARARFLEKSIDALNFSTLSSRERQVLEQPRVQEAFRADVNEALRVRVDGLLDDLLTWPHAFEVEPESVRCPVRAIHGTADDWEPLSNLQRFLPRFKDAQLILLEGLNHLGPLLYPDFVFSLATSRN